MGHGLNITLQDVLVRWKRMQGFNCMWLPGVDHAGIATQMMVEKSLKKEGTSRKELGREKFFARCVKWKEENGNLIIEWPEIAMTSITQPHHTIKLKHLKDSTRKISFI